MSETENSIPVVQSGIPCRHTLDRVECSITWHVKNDCYTPGFSIGGHDIDTNICVMTADHEDFDSYEETYGGELERGRYYYYDGELYHDEMAPYRESDEFSQFIASEVNSVIEGLNGA